MCENRVARQCSQCRFRREVGGRPCCVRNPPAPDPITGQARWPIVEPTDYCGAFAETPDPQPDINNQSCRNAASAPNHKSKIVNHELQIGLPICTDSFGPYCRIPLTQDRFAKVDPADYLWLAQFRWCCKTGPASCYAIRHIQERGRTKRIQMHRQIMATPRHLICDHINHDGLDNRKQNLRNCTTEQNNANRRKRGTGHGSRAPTSRYIGVTFCRRRRKWVSYIKHKGKSRNLGLYKIEEEAARAHDAAAWELWGEYANLNFPYDYPDHPATHQAGRGSCPVTRKTEEER
ncbi:MAG: hypothetical protein KBE65_23225 [Phycisphaerae bacterium]|nr:hypothetical protein [Phycisphaerae bacterium]